eukprot:GSChrysophyteH1.ASY1.ANO1.2788.1 assembled CDS
METSLNSAQVNIRDLVAQVKAGQINKKDAYKELHSILKANGGGETMADEQSVTGSEDDTASNSTGRISQEDRRLLINKLVEQKQQARAEAEEEVKSAHGDNRHYNDNVGDDEWRRRSPSSSQRPRSASAGRGGSYGMNDSSYFARSIDDSVIGRDSHRERIAQSEAAIRDDMFKTHNSTTRPKIKVVPPSFGDFYNRVTRWQKEKTNAATHRKHIQDESNLESCTFHPKINKNSLRALREIRGGVTKSDAADRLYKNHELSILQRSKYIEEELAREKTLEVEECTFQPDTSASNTEKFRQVRCKVTAVAKKHQYDPTSHPDAKKCTFTPKVKGVAPHMNSAQVYVSSNVVDRLTRPLVQNSEADSEMKNSDGPILDMASFMGALNQSGATSASAQVRGKTMDMSQTLSSKDKEGAQTRKVLDKKGLQNFLGRQEQSAIRREKNLDKSKQTVENSFQPQLCKKSLELTNRNNKGDFLERVERDVLRRADHEIRAAVIPDEACTFNPSITQKSLKMRPRTVYEMSRGDQMKRVTANRMMRLRSDQEELQEMTFKPEITKKAKSGAGQKVSLAHDTAKFLEKERERAQLKEAKRLAILEKREQDEVDQCTFAPATKDCPAYVRRIAKSMAVVRSTRTQVQNEPSETKPSWK